MTHDWDTGEDQQVTVPVLDGNKMVRLGGPYLNYGILQSLDSMTIAQTFTVDSSDPVIALNYNILTWDEPGYDDVGLRVRLTSPGHQVVAQRLQTGVGAGRGLSRTGWRTARLDLSGYEGDQVRLEVELRGSADDTYPTWAYIDAGHAQSPFSAPGIELKVPATSPAGKPIKVRKTVDAGSDQTFFTVPLSRLAEFEEGCMPAQVKVPFASGNGTISNVQVFSVYNGGGRPSDSVDATEGANDVWTASIECLNPFELRLSYDVTQSGDARHMVADVGGVAFADPLGTVYDSDAFDALKLKGKSDSEARAGAALAGASVTLQRKGEDGAFHKVLTGDADVIPAVSPLLTETDGTFEWMMLDDGVYRVVVSHPGYGTVTSANFDGCGCDAPLEIAMVPDKRGPKLAPKLTSTPPASTTSTEASIGFEADGGEPYSITGFECQLDGGAFAACSSPKQYAGLAVGKHDFAVRAVNATGSGPVASAAWSVKSSGAAGSIGSLKAKAAKKSAKRGKKATIKVSFRNPGTTPVSKVKICVKGPKKLVKLPRCLKIASLGAGKSITRKVKVKIKGSAKKGKKAKLRIVVSGTGVKSKTARTVIRIK